MKKTVVKRTKYKYIRTGNKSPRSWKENNNSNATKYMISEYLLNFFTILFLKGSIIKSKEIYIS